MDSEQKERLEQELRFLKESLEAEIITKEEYEKGKERVERKLREAEEAEENAEEKGEEAEEEVKEEPEEKEEPEADEKKEDIIIKEIPKEERGKIEPIAEETSKEIEEKEEPQKEQKEIKPESKEKKKAVKINKKLVWAAAILVILALVFIFFPKEDVFKKAVFAPACIDDKDCKAQGKIGACISPNTKEAVCEFKDDVKVQLIVLNDKNCASCSTARMLSIIKQLLPGAKESSVDYNSAEGKKLADELSIVALPAYIFDENITNAHNYNKIKNTLTKKNNKYLMSNAASGADYYFKRDKIPKKLDLYLIQGSSDKAEINAKEVLDLFKDDIDFTKHVIIDKGKLKQELGITTYPAFLINNQIKFSGVQAADTIKEKFCELNALVECSITLSQDIK